MTTTAIDNKHITNVKAMYSTCLANDTANDIHAESFNVLSKYLSKHKLAITDIIENRKIRKAQYNTLHFSTTEKTQLEKKYLNAEIVKAEIAEKLSTISRQLKNNSRRNVMLTFLMSNVCTFNEILLAIDLYADNKFFQLKANTSHINSVISQEIEKYKYTCTAKADNFDKATTIITFVK